MNKEFIYFCKEISCYTSDISLLVFAPTSSSPALIYDAGQYVEAKLPSGEWLPLSIANAPQDNGHLEFHIRHDNSHIFAQYFLKEINLGKKILFRGPKGNSTLARAPNRSLLFLAGGTGFAPIKALLEEALFHKKIAQSLQLYWGVRRPEDAYAEKILLQWQQTFPQFNYKIVLSRPEDFPTWSGATGYVHTTLAKEHPSLEKEVVFVSGPIAMVKVAHHLFKKQGLFEEQFISDIPITEEVS